MKVCNLKSVTKWVERLEDATKRREQVEQWMFDGVDGYYISIGRLSTRANGPDVFRTLKDALLTLIDAEISSAREALANMGVEE